MRSSHPGLDLVCNFNRDKKLESVSELFNKGFCILKNSATLEDCKVLISDLENLRTKYPYHIESSKTYSGVFRSPFIFFDSYRDLMLNEKIHQNLQEIFPCKYHLHLNRCVENKPNKMAATVEWHRDIPYLHSPSSFPLSISALTFLSKSDDIQIELLLDSHSTNFYDYENSEILKLNPKPGETIFFDSNLIHRTLPTSKTVFYNLFMFSSPIIKPVVDYSSNEAKKLLSINKYRLNEIKEKIGYEFLVPKDDYDYINSKDIK